MRVSVVIPSFNGSKWIRAAVESALTQILVGEDGLPEKYQVIVRDDGSTDDTLDVLYSIKDARLRVVEGEHMPTLPESFQAAFDLASTPFVCVLGQDDLLDPEYLSTVLREFDDPEVAQVSCRPRFIDGEGKPYYDEADTRCHIPTPPALPKDQLREALKLGNMHFGLNTYRRRAVIDVGGFDAKAGWLLDWDLYLRILESYEIKIIDKQLCSMGLRMDCTSALRMDQLPEQHKYYRHVRQKNFKPSKNMKVGIATPFYMSQEYSHYGESLLYTCRMLTQAGIEWELFRVNGDSYVDRAKNTLIANFLESDCTDYLQIDSDEQWHPNAVSRLLQHPEEIVAAAYPFKNKFEQYAGNPLLETKDGKQQYAGWRELGDGSCLLEAYNVAGGFLRIKRGVLEKFAEHYCDDIYRDDCAWPGRDARIYTQYFNCDVIGNMRYGEDSNFSRKLRDMGYKLWIDPNITIVHYGIKGWEGNLHEHILRPQKEREEAAEKRRQAEEIAGVIRGPAVTL